MADDFAIPHPRLGIDRLSHGTEQAQAVELVFLRPLVSPAQKCADRGRCGVEDVYFMPIDDAPEAVRLGKIWCAFVHQAGRAIHQRAINDVAVSGNPANVGSAPISIFLVEIEHPLRRDVSADGISAAGVHYALGFARRARRIKDI